jgi:outer membrane protein assembly factor BamB
MWEKEMKMASLIAADGKIIILEEDGTLHIAEATPSSYQELSSGDVLEGEQKSRKFYTPPVLYKGKIYVRNWIGDLVCIDVNK